MHQIFINNEPTQIFVTHQKATSDFNAKTEQNKTKVRKITYDITSSIQVWKTIVVGCRLVVSSSVTDVQSSDITGYWIDWKAEDQRNIFVDLRQQGCNCTEKIKDWTHFE